ncbi:MAG: heavy metal translocating P-type ATPase [Oscillospiraceae bacterium]|nr:heavy metal translocating P-type ATPase [Oscillospiraceae bacterium]
MKQKFDVTGMSCAACSARVEYVTKKLPGVRSAAVNLLAGSMTVNYDETVCAEETIIRAVEGAGYGASPAKNTARRLHEAQEAELKAMRRRIVLSAVFLLFLMYVSMGRMLGLPQPQALQSPKILAVTELLLTIPIIALNYRYYTRGFGALFRGAPNMDSLIAVGSAAGLLYSLYTLVQIFLPGDASALVHELYFESSGMILTLVTVGKYLETRAKGKTGRAIEKLLDLSPKTACVLRDGEELTVPVAEVEVGDTVLLRPGQSVPVDGVVLEGVSAIDQSALTGESIPVEKRPGDRVDAATINGSGFLKFRADRVGEDTTFAGIIRLVEEAGSSKAPISRLADRISGIFVPTVMGISLLTAVVWLLAGKSFSFALSNAIAVLVISCPCALGLATPVSIMVGTGQGAGSGILFRSAEALELLGRVNAVVLDKTGTLTEGKPTVTDILPESGDERELLTIAAALEQGSEHPLAAAVLEKAAEESIAIPSAEDFRSVPGRGVAATVEGLRYLAGNPAFLEENGIACPQKQTLLAEGKTLLYFAEEAGKLLGVIAAADREKPNAAQAVKRLRETGLRVYLLTGDNRAAARVIGEKLGVDEVIAEVLPQEKEQKVRALQETGKVVCMVGDGINDAPALTRADVGIAIGAGADVAIESADVVLMRSDPLDICGGVELSRAVLRNIRMNLFWAFFYNVIGIPIAAGALYLSFGIRLSPMLGAAAMSLSSFCVVSNALRLRRFRPSYEKTGKAPEEPITIPLQAEKGKKMTNLKISGMMCQHCKAHVEQALRAVPGVTEVTVDLEKGAAQVAGGEVEALIAAVKNAGYEAEKA